VFPANSDRQVAPPALARARISTPDLLTRIIRAGLADVA
jgi:hypothetical protein